MSDAYARSGVDQGAADSAVAGLVRALGKIELGRPSAQVPLPGHYASVIEVAPNLGIALSTDGVGTKLLLAEQLGKLDTVGIGASFASTLASQRLIGLVERDRALWPYAAYRAAFAGVVLAKLRRQTRS